MNEPSSTGARRWGIVAIAFIVLAACSSVPRSIAPPSVELVTLGVVQATADGQSFRVALLLDNPNDVALPVESISFNLRLAGGEGIMSGESFAPFELPPGGRETVRLDIQTDLVSSVSRLLSFVQGPEDRLAYELNGRMTLGGRPERMVPISMTGTVPLTATMGGSR